MRVLVGCEPTRPRGQQLQQLGVRSALRRREPEYSGAAREHFVEDLPRVVIGRPGAPIRAHKGLRQIAADPVPPVLAHIQTGLERGWRRPVEIAGSEGIRAPLAVAGHVIEPAPVNCVPRSAHDRIAPERVRIDRRPSGPVRDQNASGLLPPDILKGDRQPSALDGEAAEIPSGIITGDAAGAGIAQAELGLPDRARVPVDEAHAEVPRILVAVRIRLRQRAAARRPAGEGRPKTAGGHTRDRIGEVTAAIVSIESGGLDRKRDSVPRPELPVEGGSGGLSLRQPRKVPDEKVGEIGLVGGRVGQGSPIGRRRGAAPSGLNERRRLVLGRAATREREPEAFADGLHVGELEARLDLGRRPAARTRGTRKAAVAIAQQQVGADVERGPGAIEGGAYD